MAILKGFPPSNSINPTTHIPNIFDIEIKIINLSIEDVFSINKNEYMFLSIDNRYGSRCRAVCFKSDPYYSFFPPKVGGVYDFPSNTMVIWHRPVYASQKVYLGHLCQHCGTELKSDIFSSKYGDYCPNEKCWSI